MEIIVADGQRATNACVADSHIIKDSPGSIGARRGGAVKRNGAAAGSKGAGIDPIARDFYVRARNVSVACGNVESPIGIECIRGLHRIDDICVTETAQGTGKIGIGNGSSGAGGLMARCDDPAVNIETRDGTRPVLSHRHRIA